MLLTKYMFPMKAKSARLAMIAYLRDAGQNYQLSQQWSRAGTQFGVKYLGIASRNGRTENTPHGEG